VQFQNRANRSGKFCACAN